MKQNNTPIRSQVGFKNTPDLFLKNFELSFGIKKYKENIAKNLKLECIRNASGRTVRTFYAVDGSVIKKIGKVGEISFKDALKKVEEFKTDGGKASRANPSFKDVYCEYIRLKCPDFSENTLKKKNVIFRKFKKIENKPIKTIILSDIVEICDKYTSKTAMLTHIWGLANLILQFAVDSGIIAQNPLTGRKVGGRYNIKKTIGHGYLDPHKPQNLIALIKYIKNNKLSLGVKNALKMGLITGLRSKNIRTLKKNQLKKNDNGEFYLEFAADETKARKIQHLGIPSRLAAWLHSLETQNDLFFPNSFGGELSENTLSKALNGFEIYEMHEGGNFVFHSLRKVLSTFANEYGNSYIKGVSVERVLFHDPQTGVAKIYNKATNILETKRVLEWWLDYLNVASNVDILGV
ncbi:tyrosine-type recombinase/integrase [Campylobacter geochelonis]|uniref:Integrase phage family protein n=1 Tax=Campylobacter geochelonis TaxID=1780362 RepID=A0A128EI92_9BACT|nr:tyrosine-type recombinase/integrase [Campylobacter geochelonis]QKF70833.1 site-specific tyrosine recombinase, phage integrase family (INT_P4_C domain) [Campylobacter geochelonis]CZE48048.1 integrase phage family protein [Campylobacter geochelonis]